MLYLCIFFFFFVHRRFGEGRSRLMWMSCAWTVGTIIFPHLVPGDSGQCIFSRCAWQGGPRWLNYPAVLVTPAPLFTQTKPRRIERCDERANGLGPSRIRRSRFTAHGVTSSTSATAMPPWFHINDNKIALHKCLQGLGLGQTRTGASIWLRRDMQWHRTLFFRSLSDLFKCQIGLSSLIPFFNTSVWLIKTGELRTSTLKNVCCWDTWLITRLPTQF